MAASYSKQRTKPTTQPMKKVVSKTKSTKTFLDTFFIFPFGQIIMKDRIFFL